MLQACLLFSMLACAGTPRAETTGPRNLVFILTDQQRFDTMAAYGNDVIQTPHLNALTSEAMVFKRAYVTYPVCSPARASILTGLYPQDSGVLLNNIPLDDRWQTLPEMVGTENYHSAYIGKWHLGNETKAVQGFDERISTEDNYTRNDRNDNSDYHDFLLKHGYKPDRKGTFSRNRAATMPYEHSKSKFMGNKALEFIERNKHRPFILYLAFLEPHSPYNGPFDTVHDVKDLEIDASYAIESRKGGKQKTVKKPLELKQRYYGLVHQVDKSVGAVRARLKALGLDEKTVFVYTSEHGDMLGQRRAMGKNVMYDGAARIPLIIDAPGVGGGVFKAPVSHIDLVPTVMDLMGHSVPDHLPGRALMSSKSSDPSPVFLQRWSRSPGNKNKPVIAEIAYVSGDWKLTLDGKDGQEGELYNMHADPLELENLYNDERHKDIQRTLTRTLIDWAKAESIPCKHSLF